MVCVLSARPFLCFTRYCHQENLNLHSRDLGAGANSEVWIPQGRWREVCKALLPLASRQMLQHCPSLSFEPLSKVNPTPLVHPGTLQWVLLWPHGLPDTALALSCQNQCGQQPCGTLESLCFGGCCPLLSALYLAPLARLARALAAAVAVCHKRRSESKELTLRQGRLVEGGEDTCRQTSKQRTLSASLLTWATPVELVVTCWNLWRVTLIFLQVQQGAPGLDTHQAKVEGTDFLSSL